MEEKDENMKYDDYFIEKTLLKIIRKNLETCTQNNEVPSREILDTINTLVSFKNCY